MSALGALLADLLLGVASDAAEAVVRQVRRILGRDERRRRRRSRRAADPEVIFRVSAGGVPGYPVGRASVTGVLDEQGRIAWRGIEQEPVQLVLLDPDPRRPAADERWARDALVYAVGTTEGAVGELAVHPEESYVVARLIGG